MKKIPTIFKRNPDNMRELSDECNPDCLWVFAGEGYATRKYDGTAMLIREGKYYKRREIKKGKEIPFGFEQVEFDPATGSRVGWIEVHPHDLSDRWAMEAHEPGLPDGTYELLGPRVQGNREHFDKHTLFGHSMAGIFWDAPRTMEGLRFWFIDKDIEGLVFHHPDGRMAKIKKRDFGLPRQIQGERVG